MSSDKDDGYDDENETKNEDDDETVSQNEMIKKTNDILDEIIDKSNDLIIK